MRPRARILIVEDEAVVALDLKQQLAAAGFEVVGTAATGKEAVGLAAEIEVDLVLMDVELQGQMDGIGAAQAIRAHRDVPVVYLTAHADDDTLDRAKNTDPHGYLVKPYELRELQATVTMALNRHAKQQARMRSVERASEELQEIATALTRAVDASSSANKVASQAAQPRRSSSAGDAAQDEPERSASRLEDELATLSRREREVLAAVRAGGRVADIARKLFISTHTVRNHMKAIYRKLGVHSQVELLTKLLHRPG